MLLVLIYIQTGITVSWLLLLCVHHTQQYHLTNSGQCLLRKHHLWDATVKLHGIQQLLWLPLCISLFLSQEIFELRYARMPEDPPIPMKKALGSKLKKMKGISSESSDESSPEDTDSSSSEESDSESERANQLSYLQKQVQMKMVAIPQRGAGWCQMLPEVCLVYTTFHKQESWVHSKRSAGYLKFFGKTKLIW